MDHKTVQQELRDRASNKIAEHSRRFFKTGKGEYGEGDKFLGVRVPEQRKIARRFKNLPLTEVERLLQSGYHEERLTGLFILTYKFKTSEESRGDIFRCYIRNIEQVDNWDLVDSSAPKIIGPYLEHRDRTILYNWAETGTLWERRIAVMSCMYFIKRHDFEDALNIAELLLQDQHDLIHKAVGWLLREIGNIDLSVEEQFLQQQNYREMPRTMLRYAIEKFPEDKRQKYLSGTA